MKKGKKAEEKRDYDRRWYAAHPEYRKRQIKLKSERRRCNRLWVNEEKARRGCANCSEHDPVVLDFHHRDPSVKTFTFGVTGNLTLSRERISEEMDKCDVLCANCHRREHAAGV